MTNQHLYTSVSKLEIENLPFRYIIWIQLNSINSSRVAESQIYKRSRSTELNRRPAENGSEDARSKRGARQRHVFSSGARVYRVKEEATEEDVGQTRHQLVYFRRLLRHCAPYLSPRSSDPSIGIDRPTITINGIPWNSRRFETPLPSSSAPPTIRVYAREFGAILGQLPVNYARSSRIGWVGQVFLGGAGTGNGSRWRDSIYSIRFLVREAWVVFGELFEIVKFWGNARERILWENGAFDII